MKGNKISRKDFLKGMGLALGAAFATKFAGAAEFSGKKPKLSSEKETFISEYTRWLKEFNRFVEIRNQDETNIENNKKLMQLSEQAESFRPKLEKYMEDPEFASYFNYITQQITEKI
jgi:4-alpha-glucanotransferase